MKKLLVVLMVLAFVAPAMADDTLDVSGAMRVEAYSISNSNFTDADSADLAYWDQRFRMQMKIKPADGVMAVLRTDITEQPWGRYTNRPGGGASSTVTIVDEDEDGVADTDAAGNALYQSSNDASTKIQETLMIDRAYLSVDKGMVNIIGGLTAFNLGNSYAYNNQDNGIQITLKTPVSVRVGFVKESENGSLSDVEDDGTEDVDQYFINLGLKNDMLSADVFYAMQSAGNDSKDEPSLIGAMVKTKLGPANILAELNIFGGSKSDDVDYVGTQFYADVNMKLNDQTKVGVDLVYSSSNDDEDNAKMTRMASNADRVYQDNRMLGAIGAFQPLGAGGDVMDLLPDSLIDGAEAELGLVNDELGAFSTGSIGIGPYVEFMAMDGLTLLANILYLSASDDLDAVESVLIYSATLKWAMAPKTTLFVGGQVVDISLASDLDDLDVETYTGLGAFLNVSF